MSETDRATPDQAYFRAIEESFIRLRGSPFLLSPADWQQAQEWYQQEIPLALVLSSLEDLFSTRATSGKRGRIQSLKYCSGAVEQAWSDYQDLAATGESRAAQPLDAKARLQSLSDAIPAEFPLRAEVCAQILALEGSAEEIERGLLELDRLAVDTAYRQLTQADKTELDRSVDLAMDRLEPRIDMASQEDVRRRLREQGLRSAVGLPFLSLFSPESSS